MYNIYIDIKNIYVCEYKKREEHDIMLIIET